MRRAHLMVMSLVAVLVGVVVVASPLFETSAGSSPPEVVLASSAAPTTATTGPATTGPAAVEAATVEAPAVPPPPASDVSAPLVAMYGDSLGLEVGTALHDQFPELQVRLSAWPGVALCDYLGRIEADLATVRPAAVVVMFTGNTFTPCARPGGREPTDVEREAQFRADLDRVATMATGAGVPLFLVSQPPLPYPFALQPDLSPVLPEVAAVERARGRDVTYLDAGAALAGPDRAWEPELPCLADEGADVGCQDGMIRVRANDGRHLCPSSDGVTASCPVWSSGAFRMAAEIDAGVRPRLA